MHEAALMKRALLALSVLAFASCAKTPANAPVIGSSTALPNPETEARPEGAFATVNGVKLHYLTAGDPGKGTPVVLLHGYAETSHMWRPLLAALSQQHVVLAPDLRGAGDSERPDNGYDKKTMAADIHALVKSLGMQKIKIVGHDIGLMVAYAYAAQYPKEVESIVLVDAFLPGVGAWKEVLLTRELWHLDFYGETPLKLVAGRERMYFDHLWNDLAADKTHSISEADRQLYAAAYARNGGMRAGFEYFRALATDAADFAEFAKTKLLIPMLVLAGEKGSGTHLIEQACLVATHVDGVVVQGAGHWLMEEAPKEVRSRLVDFLDSDAPPSGTSCAPKM
jgi:pimeloyl-ACP methyl ester carboxylesterase